MLRVGLTGGIASGKSAVVARLGELGAVIIDSDRLAREVVAPGSSGLAAVEAEFGDAILASDGSLDRAALAAIVFSDADARARLEAITHPLIRELSAGREREAVATDPAVILVHDIPLLVEKGMADRFDLVVVVEADEARRVQRMVQARGMSVEEARGRIGAQATDEQRRAVADVVLENNGTIEELLARVDELWDRQLRPRRSTRAT